MGIELIFGAASLAVGLISGAKATAEQNKAAAAAKQANLVRSAQQKVEAAEQRRQLLREERMRRAKMLQGAENSGTSGASGLTGGLSAISTNVDNMLGGQLGATKANEAINSWEQKAVNYENKSRQTLMWGEVFQNGISTIGGIWE